MNGNVAGGLVGHMHVVPLMHQADQGSSHGDDVIVRMGAQHQHFLGEGLGCHGAGAVVGVGFASGPAGDGVLKVVEDLDVDLVESARYVEEFLKRMLKVVCLRELEDWLVHLLAEPDDGLAAELGSPFAGAYAPGGDHAGEQASGYLVHEHHHIIVMLEIGRRAVRAYLSLNDPGYGVGLGLAPGHQYHALGAHHGADAHGDCLFGSYGDIPVEITGLTLAAGVAEQHGAGAGTVGRSGFVETHLSLLAYADDEEVQLAGGLVEALAVGGHIFVRHGAVGDVDVLGLDVHVVQQFEVQVAVAALHVGGRRGIVLVYAVHLDILERDAPLAVIAGKHLIQRSRGGSCGQAKPEGAPRILLFEFLERLYDYVGQFTAALGRICINFSENLVISVKDIFRKIFGNQSPVFGQRKMSHSMLKEMKSNGESGHHDGNHAHQLDEDVQRRA